jgi:hypothetical protein
MCPSPGMHHPSKKDIIDLAFIFVEKIIKEKSFQIKKKEVPILHGSDDFIIIVD